MLPTDLQSGSPLHFASPAGWLALVVATPYPPRLLWMALPAGAAFARLWLPFRRGGAPAVAR